MTRHGLNGTAMLPWDLPDGELDDVVQDWPGFYFYGSDKIAFEFGFICETIVSDWRDLRGPKLNILPPAPAD